MAKKKPSLMELAMQRPPKKPPRNKSWFDKLKDQNAKLAGEIFDFVTLWSTDHELRKRFNSQEDLARFIREIPEVAEMQTNLPGIVDFISRVTRGKLKHEPER